MHYAVKKRMSTCARLCHGIGPSLQGKQELAQRLAREFPNVFQIAPLHCTPAYGQDDTTSSASDDVTTDRTVSASDFQVSVWCWLSPCQLQKKYKVDTGIAYSVCEML